MGCFESKDGPFEVAFRSHEFQRNMIQFTAMQLNKKEIHKLYNIFTKVDVDGSGSIALAELLAHIDIDRTPFTEKIFSIFDEDRSGEIDFREFVLSLWNYCTLTKATLDMFAFDLYDRDSSGELSASEVTRMLQDIYGKNEAKNNFHAKSVAAELKAIEKAGQLLTLEQFRTFVKTHQALLFPAFQMQSGLQRKILGTAFWERNASKRIKLTDGKYVSVGHFILGHMDGSKKSPVLTHSDYVVDDHPLHKVAEATGTRASRRKSVAHNELRASFAAPSGAAAGPPPSTGLSLKPPPHGQLESQNSRWGQSFRNISGLFSGNSDSGSPGSSTKPGKGARSSKVAATSSREPPLDAHTRANSGATNGSSFTETPGAPGLRSGGTGNKSHENMIGLVQPMTGSVVSPRDPSHRESHRDGRRKSKDGLDVPSGVLVNHALTTNTLAKIEAASPIEAWHNQTTGRGNKAAPSSKQVSNVEAFDEDNNIGGGKAKARRGSVMAGATASSENTNHISAVSAQISTVHSITHKRRQSVS